MPRRTELALSVAALGLLLVVVGLFQELAHIPNSEAVIVTGWDRGLSHEEWFLAYVAGAGLLGAVAGLQWPRWAGIVPVLSGGTIAFFALRAASHYYGPGPIALGLEPYLLVAGALCLIGAGVVGLTAPVGDGDDVVAAAAQSDAEPQG